MGKERDPTALLKSIKIRVKSLAKSIIIGVVVYCPYDIIFIRPSREACMNFSLGLLQD
ncbi:MAG: hypothetical protein WCZ27_05225 [Tissierellaceae bacterium]